MSDASAKQPRLLSLDAFRGLTILAMVLVNNPGSWGSLYPPLAHASWHGWTPTDLVFPFFLFMVGASLAYSLRKYREGTTIDPSVYWRIGRRTLVLLALGLFLTFAGTLYEYLRGYSEALSFAAWRWPGVLQRIALVYCAASLIVLHVGIRGQAALAVAILLGYWAALAWLPTRDDYAGNLSPEGNVVRVVDRAIIGEAHMYTQAKVEKTEPEGLLSTLPAIVTSLIGYWTGLLIQRRGCNWRTVGLLVGYGLVLAAAGQLWHEAFPINKKLWTSSFVLLTGGLGMVSFGLCVAAFDLLGLRRLGRGLEIVGVNAIFVFVGSGLVAMVLGRSRIGTGEPRVTAQSWIYQHWFAEPIGRISADPRLASLAFALTVVACWWIIVWAMSRRGWSVRV